MMWCNMPHGLHMYVGHLNQPGSFEVQVIAIITYAQRVTVGVESISPACVQNKG